MRSGAAFEDLFVDEYPHVVRLVSFIVHDQGRAEDVAQDAFVQSTNEVSANTPLS